MSRYKWRSCSHHPASEWVSFGRYRMRMVHGMDHILHKFFLFLTTQSSGQKNENKVPGCAQLWLLPPWGHSRALGDRHSMNLRIFVVPCYISTSFKKYAICFIWRQTVLLVSDKLVRNRCTVNQPPSLSHFSYGKNDRTLASLVRYIKINVLMSFTTTHAGNANSSGFVSKYTLQTGGIMIASAKNATMPMILPLKAHF